MSRQSRSRKAWHPGPAPATVWVDERAAEDPRYGYRLVDNPPEVKAQQAHLTGARLSDLRARAQRRKNGARAAKLLRRFRVDAQLYAAGVRCTAGMVVTDRTLAELNQGTLEVSPTGVLRKAGETRQNVNPVSRHQRRANFATALPRDVKLAARAGGFRRVLREAWKVYRGHAVRDVGPRLEGGAS